MFKVNKDVGTKSLTCFTPFCIVSLTDFEQINICWKIILNVNEGDYALKMRQSIQEWTK